MTRRGRSPAVKCAVGSSCNSLHSLDNPQGNNLPCDPGPLFPVHQARSDSSFFYRPKDNFGIEPSRDIGVNMEVKQSRENEPLLYSKQPSPRECLKSSPRLEKKDILTPQQKLAEADRLKRVRAEQTATISKALKVRDDPLSFKQRLEADAERRIDFPREGPSLTKGLKKDWSYAQQLDDDWRRDSPLNCPMKLPWNDRCLCYDCALVSHGAEPRIASVFARPDILSPRGPLCMTKRAADAPSAKQAGTLGTGANRSASVLNREKKIRPGLEAMCCAPTANNSAESLPKLARVAANPSPAAQQAKQEEERRAAMGKDALPATDESKESLLAGKELETQKRERRREVMRKLAREAKEAMESSPAWQYQSIKITDLQKMTDELKESKDKLAIVEEVLKLNQDIETKLIDILRRDNSFNQQDQDQDKTSQASAAPTSKVESQAPAQTYMASTPSKKRVDTSKVPSSPTTTPSKREGPNRTTTAVTRQTPSYGLREKLLLALSIFDLTLRLITLAVFWCCLAWPHAGSRTIQTTIHYIIPATSFLGIGRGLFADSLKGGRGGAARERILRIVGRTDLAASCVYFLLVLTFLAEAIVIISALL